MGEHWHFKLTAVGRKTAPHSHKGGNKRHEYKKLVEYGRTRKSLLANRFKDF